MASAEAACEPEQTEMDLLQRASRTQQQTPPPISGKKHHRSPSPIHVASKRHALSAERAPSPDSLILESATNRPPSPKSPIIESAADEFPTSNSSLLKSPTNNSLTPKLCKTVGSEDNWHCPNCGRRCWLCNLTSAAPPDRLEPGDEEELERARMAVDCTSSTVDTSCTAPSSKKRKKDLFALQGKKLIGPKDQGFKDHILDPLRVFWATRPHLNSKPPLSLTSQLLAQTRVMIRSDDKNLERIMMDFREYKARPYDEHALSTLCWDSIVLRDSWVENPLINFSKEGKEDVVNDDEPFKLCVRRDKWKPQKQGPFVPEGKFVYDWDLEPDTSYAVSIRMFNLEYRNILHVDAFQAWVAEKDVAVCPYLTFEYKCSNKGGRQAQATNQGTAAAVLWLYQRKNLRNTIGKTFDNLSHFLITIVDSFYEISEVWLKGDAYLVDQQVAGDLIKIEDLRLYIEWSNAIHAWGLGSNASTFKEDIEALVELNRTQTLSTRPPPAGTVSPMGLPAPRPGE